MPVVRDDMSPMDSTPPALVLSLDFELHWGVRDRVRTADAYARNLSGVRSAVPRLLRLLEEFSVAATWATVGFLFASSREELQFHAPSVRPAYKDPKLSPYAEEIGRDEDEDPLHFAGSLIELIRATPRQEIATHTFSHFYCGEEGGTAEAFRADLQAAVSIAARWGLALKSIVFPRNQHNPRYDDVLLEAGIVAYRGNPPSRAWRFTDGAEGRALRKRAVRLADSYAGVTGPGTTPWSYVLRPSGLADVRASYPLRPHDPKLRPLQALHLRRIRHSLRHAARNREIFHLWWHPHNFGIHTDENLAFLRQVLEEWDRLRRDQGMTSMAMVEVAEVARRSGRRESPPAGSLQGS